MFRTVIKRATLSVALLQFVGVGIYWYLIKRKEKMIRDSQDDVMIFREYVCELHDVNKNCDPCGDPRCVVGHIRRIKSYIAKAKSSVYVCAYLLCIEEIAEELVNSLIRRHKVKVIVDHTMSSISASKANFLQKRGISVRVLLTDDHMHHKFIIIDRERVLTGSLNWTWQGAYTNWEHVRNQTEPRVVQQFCKTFDEMWKSLEPLPYTLA